MKDNAKRVWIYCAIDAPEDEHNLLKRQWQTLVDYAEQMGFVLIGSSSDMGFQPFWSRTGFNEFIEQAKNGKIDILLLADLRSLGQHTMQPVQMQTMLRSLGVALYTPLTGRYSFE